MTVGGGREPTMKTEGIGDRDSDAWIAALRCLMAIDGADERTALALAKAARRYVVRAKGLSPE